MRCLLACLALLAIALPPAAGAVKTQMVQFPSGAEILRGYLAVPSTRGEHPALVVIQEWWGLNDWIKEQAREFAGQGYVALAPDLYHGQVATAPEEARKLMLGMPAERALRDLQAAFAYLAALPNVDGQKIGSIGWCMGGGLSLQLAIHQPQLAACVVNYGRLTTDSAAIRRIRAPLLGNFGAEDRGIPPSAVHAFEKALQSAGKSIDARIFAGAGHAFENLNNQGGYRPEAARQARARTLAFFAKHLK